MEKDCNGLTLLHWAAGRGHHGTAALLLDRSRVAALLARGAAFARLRCWPLARQHLERARACASLICQSVLTACAMAASAATSSFTANDTVKPTFRWYAFVAWSRSSSEAPGSTRIGRTGPCDMPPVDQVNRNPWLCTGALSRERDLSLECTHRGLPGLTLSQQHSTT